MIEDLVKTIGEYRKIPYPADQMTVWPISPRVNSPKNDDLGILEPIVADVKARRQATG